jgi:hypothetical protein
MPIRSVSAEKACQNSGRIRDRTLDFSRVKAEPRVDMMKVFREGCQFPGYSPALRFSGVALRAFERCNDPAARASPVPNLEIEARRFSAFQRKCRLRRFAALNA